jgi:hypothetical protein
MFQIIWHHRSRLFAQDAPGWLPSEFLQKFVGSTVGLSRVNKSYAILLICAQNGICFAREEIEPELEARRGN